MAADSKSNRRSSGGASSAESDKRTTSRRRAGGEQEVGGGRRAAAGARKGTSASRKTASKRTGEAGGRKTATKRGAQSEREGKGRKTAAKKSGGGRSAAKGASSRRAAGAGTRGQGAKASARGSRGSAKPTGGRSTRRKTDALSLLKEDHERVDDMFKKYERMKEGDERKQQMLQQILEEVRVHAQVEEELFYPALRTVLEEDGKEKEIKLISEADVEHETVKWLMSEIEGGQMESAMVDARVKVMGEYIRHHVEEEEGQIFRAAKRSEIDLEELGRQMEARKRELMGGEPGESSGEEDMAAMGILGSDSAQRGGTQPGTH